MVNDHVRQVLRVRLSQGIGDWRDAPEAFRGYVDGFMSIKEDRDGNLALGSPEDGGLAWRFFNLEAQLLEQLSTAQLQQCMGLALGRRPVASVRYPAR